MRARPSATVSLAVFSSLLFLAASGCAPPPPRTYKVALDDKALADIAPENATYASCFVTGATSDARRTTATSGLLSQYELTIWEGVDGKLYLELPTMRFDLGDSPSISFAGLVEGQSKDLSFSATRTDVSVLTLPRIKTTVTTSAKLVFKDLGPSTTGTLELQSNYACAANPDTCPNPIEGANMRSCAITLPFVARQVQVTEFSTFGS